MTKSVFCGSRIGPDKTAGPQERASEIAGNDQQGIMQAAAGKCLEDRFSRSPGGLAVIAEAAKLICRTDLIRIAVVSRIIGLFRSAAIKESASSSVRTG